MDQNNNQRQQFAVTTNMVSLFDDQSVQLRIGGLDNAMSVALWIPVPGENGKNTYPQDHRPSVVLAPERVSALASVLRNDVIPAIAEGRHIDRSIFTSRKMSSMIQIKSDDEGIFLYLHLDIDENRIPKNTYRFHFEDAMILTAYRPVTGEYDIDKIYATFYLFCQTVEAFTQNGTGISTHSDRVINRYTLDKIFRYLEGIAQKLGVVIQNPTYGNRSSSNSSGGGFTPQGATPAPQMQEVNSLSDML